MPRPEFPHCTVITGLLCFSFHPGIAHLGVKRRVLCSVSGSAAPPTFPEHLYPLPFNSMSSRCHHTLSNSILQVTCGFSRHLVLFMTQATASTFPQMGQVLYTLLVVPQNNIVLALHSDPDFRFLPSQGSGPRPQRSGWQGQLQGRSPLYGHIFLAKNLISVPDLLLLSSSSSHRHFPQERQLTR